MAMTGPGVPAVVATPDQPSISNPGKPDSIIVGTSGSCGTRVVVVTASARALPARIERGVLVHRLRDRDLGRRRKQRIAVGRRLRHQLATDEDAAGSAVLDHHGLAQRFGQARPEYPGGEVGDAARRARDDVTDRT